MQKHVCAVQVHVVGCLVFNGTLQPKVFTNFPNIANDANLTIHIIQHIINSWEDELPYKLYLQMDNTSRENKNSLLFSYLNMLVEKRIFRKVRVSFLLVGHTHDQIDQMS